MTHPNDIAPNIPSQPPDPPEEPELTVWEAEEWLARIERLGGSICEYAPAWLCNNQWDSPTNSHACVDCNPSKAIIEALTRPSKVETAAFAYYRAVGSLREQYSLDIRNYDDEMDACEAVDESREALIAACKEAQP